MNTEHSEALSREASRLEEDALYSAKGHFEAASAWSARHLWIGIPAAVLAALSAGSAMKGMPEVAAVLAAIVTALTALLTFLNPSERASAHHRAGTKFSAIRNEVRILREIDLPQDAGGHAGAERLKSLSRARDAFYSTQVANPARCARVPRRGSLDTAAYI